MPDKSLILVNRERTKTFIFAKIKNHRRYRGFRPQRIVKFGHVFSGSAHPLHKRKNCKKCQRNLLIRINIVVLIPQTPAKRAFRETKICFGFYYIFPPQKKRAKTRSLFGIMNSREYENIINPFFFSCFEYFPVG